MPEDGKRLAEQPTEAYARGETLSGVFDESSTADDRMHAARERVREAEPRQRQAETDLEDLLQCTQIAAIFLDGDFRVRSFTPAATDLYQLTADDLGRPFSQLDFQTDPPAPLDSTQTLGDAVETQLTTRTGRVYRRRVKVNRSISGEVTGAVVAFCPVTWDGGAAAGSEVTGVTRSKVAKLHATLAMALSQPHPREVVLQTCCDHLLRGLDLTAAAVWLLDPQGSSLRLAAKGGDEAAIAELPTNLTEDAAGPRLAGATVIAMRPPSEPALRVAETETSYDSDAAESRCLVSFPLLVEERKIGVVALALAQELPSEILDEIRPMIDAIAQCMRRKEVEAEIANSERRLRVAMESGHIGAWEWDLGTDEVIFDSSQYEVLGWPNGSPADSNRFFAAIHPEDLAEVRAALDRSIHHGEDFEHLFRFVRPDGKVRWLAGRGNVILDEHRRPTRMIGVNWDVTSRKLSEQRVRESEHRLRESEKRYRLALSAANLGTWRTDRTLGVTERDAYFNRMLGLGDLPSTVPIEDLYNRVHEADREQVRRAIEQAHATVAPYDLTYRIRRPDGMMRWVRDTAQPLATPAGDGNHWIGATADVTDQKEFEQSLEVSRRMAEAANRSRGEFLANMSHEIRTPMTAILGYADLLSGHLQDPDNLQCIETIRRNGKYLLDIINDILDLSKIDAGKIEIEHERVRPDTLIGDIRSLMDVRAKEKQVPLQIKFDGKIPAVIETDAVRLRQILLNLIGNAIKFTDDGYVQLVIRYLAEDQMMQFDIIDTGIGISDKDLETLFEPFIQADTSVTRTHGGTGLGLTISRRLARILGGDIAVKSKINEGSIFSVTIHCGSQAQVEMIEPDLNSQLPPDQAEVSAVIDGCVLVVDDRRDIRFLAQHFIEKAGGSVMLATNGLEAIEIISDPTRGPKVDLVLMDMQMPVMDGYEAAARLREQAFERPIIALTAHAMKSDRDKCLDAGCTDYTTKPLHGPNLVRMIADHINRSDRAAT